MRLGEIVQLRADDIERIDGVDVIQVRKDEKSDKRLKTAASERLVPIHSELKKIGFMAYAQTQRRKGDTRLFPELPKSKNGYYSNPFQKWFSRFLKKAGLKTPTTSFHSFRHRFRDALREAGIASEIVQSLGGWAPSRNAEANYGSGYRARILACELDKVTYPDLDL